MLWTMYMLNSLGQVVFIRHNVTDEVRMLMGKEWITAYAQESEI